MNGQVDFSIQDPSPASGSPSGVWVNTLLDSSNYLLTKVHANKAYPGKWIVTNVTATPGAAAGSYDVAVTFNSGKPIRGGFYLFTIRDSSNGNSSVQDNAENHLDGVFYGTFPSGNGINGSDFVAELDAYHDKVFAPQTIVGTSSARQRRRGRPADRLRAQWCLLAGSPPWRQPGLWHDFHHSGPPARGAQRSLCRQDPRRPSGGEQPSHFQTDKDADTATT